jgi:hypothetical protein
VDVSAGGLGFKGPTSNDYQPAYRLNSGTSFSAPLVSSIIGLYQSWRLGQGLGLATPQEVLLRVRDTADPVDVLNPAYAGKLGGGRANAMRMLFDPPTSFITAAGGPVESTPAFVDWGGLEEAIVFGTTSFEVVAVSGGDGSLLAGWPVATGGAVRGDVAVFDLDLDGEEEILVGADDGKVYALNPDGSAVAGWPVTIGGTVRSGPALADVAGGPEYEVVMGTAGPGAIYVLDRFGQAVAGWPVGFSGDVVATPALADLDNDGLAEIAVGASDSSVSLLAGSGTMMPGWPVKVGDAVLSSPSIGDLDGNGSRDIVAGCSDGQVYAWSASGVSLTGWPVSAGGAVLSSPALVKLDGDDFLEVVVGTDNSTVQAWHHDGSVLAGWPYTADTMVRSAAAVADVDGDGDPEIVAGTVGGRVHAINADGSALLHWPRTMGGPSGRGASLGDPDDDGRLEIVMGSADGLLYAWDLGSGTFDAANTPWFTAGRSFLRQGAVELPSIDVPGFTPATKLRLRLSPNPSRGPALLLVSRGQQSDDVVRVSVFDLSGRKVAGETIPFDATGVAAWNLGEHSRRSRPLTAGVYFIRVATETGIARAKWVLLP